MRSEAAETRRGEILHAGESSLAGIEEGFGMKKRSAEDDYRRYSMGHSH
jgi:hypothetical protein